jgi:hypothetical protein
MQSCAAEHDTRRLLDEVTPVIEGVLRGRVDASEREELFSEVILRLLRRLQGLQSEAVPDPITNLSGYAAVTAFHVVRTSAAFALWQLPSGQSVCGRASWAGIVFEECSEDDLDRIPPLSPRHSAQIEHVLDHVFDHLRKPLELERLVETIAKLFQLPVTSQNGWRGEQIETPSIESSLDHRSALVEVWREVELLPSRQRIALLLGLRDEDGSSIASLLILLRIVTFDELAAAVELSSGELAAIWDRLPLPDLAIAERLGLSRQQVINLRKSARDRLGRRFPGLDNRQPEVYS